MRGRCLALICVGALAWTGLAGGGDPATRPGPASKPVSATRPADRLGPFIRAVRGADNPRAAMSAYARGCAIDRSRTDIHDAYMRRMLKFGLPQIAHYPAMVLVGLDPNNGLAWGVVGYNRGKRGKLAEALSATVRCLEKIRDDPSVLHNAGQLVAWYDGQRGTRKISDHLRRSLARMKSELNDRKPYSKAYNAIKTAYKKRQDIKDEFDEKIKIAKAKLEQVKQLSRRKRAEYDDLVSDIKSHKRQRGSLRRELHRLENDDDDDDFSKSRRIRELRRRIREADAVILDLERKLDRLSRHARRIVADLRRDKSALARLGRESLKAQGKVKLSFRWDPPAVDGVVTPEVAFPLSPATTRASAPADSETEAAQRLKLARLYLSHQMNDKAVKILRGIISDYGSTKAAGEAKKLLASLKPPE